MIVNVMSPIRLDRLFENLTRLPDFETDDQMRWTLSFVLSLSPATFLPLVSSLPAPFDVPADAHALLVGLWNENFADYHSKIFDSADCRVVLDGKELARPRNR